MKTNSRDISLDSVLNVRDIGGIKTTSGQIIKHHRLIRGANPDHVSEQDLNILVVDMNVTLFLDLRASDQFESAVDSAIGRRGIERMNVPFSDVVPNRQPVVDQVLDLVERGVSFDFRSEYAKYLGRSERVSTALSAIAENPGGVFMHCSAGKDRTGVIVAATLAAVGVHRHDIVDDYAKTNQVKGHVLEQAFANSEKARTLWDSLDHEVLDSFVSAPPEAMEYMLDSALREYGSLRDYLLQLSDGPKLVEKLEETLLG